MEMSTAEPPATNVIIGEAWSRVDESAKIHGKALIPRISRNNNLYTKKELARFHNKTVPLNWEHNPDKIIGTATFSYNSELETVFYEGEVTDPAAAILARNRLLYTSIEANPSSAKEICNGPDDCFSMPKGLTPIALALTETPGVPETSVSLLESVIREHSEDLEKKYAPHQKNLKNEAHIERLLLLAQHVVENLGQYEIRCPDCGQPDGLFGEKIIEIKKIFDSINNESTESIKKEICSDCGCDSTTDHDFTPPE